MATMNIFSAEMETGSRQIQDYAPGLRRLLGAGQGQLDHLQNEVWCPLQLQCTRQNMEERGSVWGKVGLPCCCPHTFLLELSGMSNLHHCYRLRARGPW